MFLTPVCVCVHRGGPRSRSGEGPRSRSRWGGPRSRSRWVVSQVQVQGGVPGPGSVRGPRSRGSQSQIWGRVPSLSKGKKFFDTRFGLNTCSDWGKNFLLRDPPPPVKGKIFDTRFGLIYVQTREKIFCRGTPPPPPQ